MTLIEMLVAISMTAVVLSVLVVSLQATYLLDRRVRHDSERASIMSRLSTHLRDDIHSAMAFEVRENENAAGSLELRLSDEESITYASSASGIDRVRRRGTEVIHRDSFRFPRELTQSWSVDEQNGKTIVGLEVQRSLESTSAQVNRSPITIRVDAVLGSDHRFTESEAQ